MTLIKGGLKGRDKKKIFKVKEKVRSLSEEKKQREQTSKKLSFKLKKLQRDHDILQEKMRDKSTERSELLREREDLNHFITVNKQGIKRIITALTFRSREVEDRSLEATKRIHDIDILIEKSDHFFQKNGKKDERLKSDIDSLRRDLDLLKDEIRGLHKNISETQKELDDKNPSSSIPDPI